METSGVIAKCWTFDFLINQIMRITPHFHCCPVCRCACVFSHCIFFIYRRVHIDSAPKTYILFHYIFFLPLLMRIFFLFHFNFNIFFMVNSENTVLTLSCATVDKINRKSKSWTQFERWSFKNVEKHVQTLWEKSKFLWVYELKCWNWLLKVHFTCWPVLKTTPSLFLYFQFPFLIFQNCLPGEFPALYYKMSKYNWSGNQVIENPLYLECITKVWLFKKRKIKNFGNFTSLLPNL